MEALLCSSSCHARLVAARQKNRKCDGLFFARDDKTNCLNEMMIRRCRGEREGPIASFSFSRTETKRVNLLAIKIQ